LEKATKFAASTIPKKQFEIVLEKMHNIILAILREDIIRKGKGVRELIPYPHPDPS